MTRSTRKFASAVILAAGLTLTSVPAFASDEAPAEQVEAAQVATSAPMAEETTEAPAEQVEEAKEETAPVEAETSEPASEEQTEAPVAEEAKAEPVVEEPKNEEPKAEEPKKDQPRVEEPKKAEVDCTDPLTSNGHLAKHYPTATWTFTVKNGCAYTGFLQSWALSTPYYSEPQTLLSTDSGSFEGGEHSLTVSVKVPAEVRKEFGCYIQLDGGNGQPNAQGDWQYGNRLRVTTIGDEGACQVTEEPPAPPVEEEPPATEEPPAPPVAEEPPAPVTPAPPVVETPEVPVVKLVPPVMRLAPPVVDTPAVTITAEPRLAELPHTGASDTQLLMLVAGLAFIALGALGLKVSGRTR